MKMNREDEEDDYSGLYREVVALLKERCLSICSHPSCDALIATSHTSKSSRHIIESEMCDSCNLWFCKDHLKRSEDQDYCFDCIKLLELLTEMEKERAELLERELSNTSDYNPELVRLIRLEPDIDRLKELIVALKKNSLIKCDALHCNELLVSWGRHEDYPDLKGFKHVELSEICWSCDNHFCKEHCKVDVRPGKEGELVCIRCITFHQWRTNQKE